MLTAVIFFFFFEILFITRCIGNVMYKLCIKFVFFFWMEWCLEFVQITFILFFFSLQN
jgi:hypothetical protein